MNLLDLAKLRRKAVDHSVSVGHRVDAIDESLEFGRFRVLLRQRRLLAGGEPVELGARAFEILMVLVEADGALVAKGELLQLVWPGVVVSPENLRVQIFALRKALAEDRELVKTENGRGYRFTGAVRRLGPDRTGGRRRLRCQWGYPDRSEQHAIRSRLTGCGYAETLLDPAG